MPAYLVICRKWIFVQKYFILTQLGTDQRHSCEGGNLGSAVHLKVLSHCYASWIPAFAGMTNRG